MLPNNYLLSSKKINIRFDQSVIAWNIVSNDLLPICFDYVWPNMQFIKISPSFSDYKVSCILFYIISVIEDNKNLTDNLQFVESTIAKILCCIALRWFFIIAILSNKTPGTLRFMQFLDLSAQKWLPFTLVLLTS